jgi:pimeloyl-ACP methyl ester carboxylesterase
MPAPPERVILIHGAWAGPWVWDALIPELSARGLRAEALALPGDGTHPIAPEDAVEADFHTCIANAISAEPGSVALVGHSGGGTLVTAGAEAFPDKVSHGIWIAGMLIPDGRSFDDIQNDIAGPGKRFGVSDHVLHSADGLTSTVPPETAMKFFFQDAAPDVATEAASRLTSQPAAGHRLRTKTSAEFDILPKLYVCAEKDQSVIPAAQQAMAYSTTNISLTTIPTGHVPQLTQPARLAEVLAEWFASFN